MNSLSKIFKLIKPWVIYWFANIITSIIVITIFTAINAYLVQSGVSKSETYDEIALYSAVPATIIASFVCIPIFLRMYKKSTLDNKLKPTNPLNIRNIIMLILLGITLNFSTSLLLQAVDASSLFPSYNESMRVFEVTNKYLSILLIVIIAPVTEELLMRGLIYSNLRTVMGFTSANIIQASLFGIMHGNILQGLYAFVLGIILGFIYDKYRTLYAPIILHLSINTASYLVEYVVANEMFTLNTVVIGTLLINMFISLSLLYYIRENVNVLDKYNINQ